MARFPGRVLLFSPIVGEAADEENMRFFVPPRARSLSRLIERGVYQMPERCEIHVGEMDWQSNPANVLGMGAALGVPVTVVPGEGHRLDPVYVRRVLDTWL